MMTKPHVYRIGDKVRIIRPRFILRVGYELTPGTVRAVVAMRGFGGKERKLFYKEVVPYGQVYCDGMTWDRTGLVYTVAGKSTVMTGKYYPPSGGQGFDGDWDYEPGGLEDMQCHVLLDIGGEKIEQCDVELMKGVGA
jgi:hypothetical protein